MMGNSLTEHKLFFGLRDGVLIDISEVENGLACNCVCPECNEPLVAKKGRIKVHHFAHHSKIDCNKAYETSLHLAAKFILEKNKRLFVPRVTASRGLNHDKVVLYEEKKLEFDNVYLEKRIEDIIPDIVLEIKGKPLIVEIAVSHFVDKEKKKKIKALGISAIEIDLSKIKTALTFDELEHFIISDLSSKKWIFNAKRNAFKNDFKQLVKKRQLINRAMTKHIDNCPINARTWQGKAYANFRRDCLQCEYIYNVEYEKGGYDYKQIGCLGHSKERISDVIKKHVKA